eukprot:COSAG04_NODE_5073_length_1755_cov_1.938406_1_plen_265_part_00
MGADPAELRVGLEPGDHRVLFEQRGVPVLPLLVAPAAQRRLHRRAGDGEQLHRVLPLPRRADLHRRRARPAPEPRQLAKAVALLVLVDAPRGVDERVRVARLDDVQRVLAVRLALSLGQDLIARVEGAAHRRVRHLADSGRRQIVQERMRFLEQPNLAVQLGARVRRAHRHGGRAAPCVERQCSCGRAGLLRLRPAAGVSREPRSAAAVHEASPLTDRCAAAAALAGERHAARLPGLWGSKSQLRRLGRPLHLCCGRAPPPRWR